MSGTGNYILTIYYENNEVPHMWMRVEKPDGTAIEAGLGPAGGSAREMLPNFINGAGAIHGEDHRQHLIEQGATFYTLGNGAETLDPTKGADLFNALQKIKFDYDNDLNLPTYNASTPSTDICSGFVETLLQQNGLGSIADRVTPADLPHLIDRSELITGMPSIGDVLEATTGQDFGDSTSPDWYEWGAGTAQKIENIADFFQTKEQQLSDGEYLAFALGKDNAASILAKGKELGVFIDNTGQAFTNSVNNLWSGVTNTVNSITTSITSAYDDFMSAIANSIRKDPLIIDMGGNGLQLNSWQQSGVQFDMDGNGTPENTGWVKSAASGGDDAFLVIDKNGNGNVDSVDELFGNNTNTGFEELRKYDSNGDNVINSSDTQFNLLKLWKDADADGVVDAANDNWTMRRMAA